jgi:hypothetical protein
MGEAIKTDVDGGLNAEVCYFVGVAQAVLISNVYFVIFYNCSMPLSSSAKFGEKRSSGTRFLRREHFWNPSFIRYKGTLRNKA